MDLVIVTNEGLEIKAVLARPFLCEENKIAVVTGKDQPSRTLDLSKISCILFSENPQPERAVRNEAAAEVVEILTGECFQVRIEENNIHINGFYATPVAESLPYRLIFFCFSGIRSRDRRRTLGQILVSQNAISMDNLRQALSDQRELRTSQLGEIIAKTSDISQAAIEETLSSTSQVTTASLKVGEILIEAGLVTREQVESALAIQVIGKKVKIGELLVKNKLITETQLLTALAAKFRMSFVDLNSCVPETAALKLLPEEIAKRMQVLPIQVVGKVLVIATSAPADPGISDIMRFATNRSIELVVAASEQIATAIDKYYSGNVSEGNSISTLIGEMGMEFVTSPEERLEDAKYVEPDSKVIQLVNKVFNEAFSLGASDIHFEPGLGARTFLIRYRIDGECRIAHEIANAYRNAIISRIKILANLDIAERRKPQSGKILMRYQGREFEFRVEITPTVGSHEDAVLRLFTATSHLPLDSMGLSQGNLDRLKRIVSMPYGLVLCVGPTGSGKTTTIHAALAQINNPVRKIWTAEDPVEIIQHGIRQVQVNPSIGFCFSDALRSFLRADPDVILIGEMRDAETAKISIEASLTGHLVFSTLHTNSAPETVVRLVEMGLDRFTFADALLVVLAQRLVRKLCDHCKKPYRVTRQEYDRLVCEYSSELFQAHEMPPYDDNLTLMKSVGCDKCDGAGYKGRLALHELMEASHDVRNAVKERASVQELRSLAISGGMRTLKMDGIKKVFDGLTDYQQVAKVCG